MAVTVGSASTRESPARSSARIVKFEALESWPGYSGEAWVPCKLTFADDCSPALHLAPFVGSDCIIVYENSD